MSWLLVVQPDRVQAAALRNALHPHIGENVVVVVESLDEALASIDDGVPDVILLPDLIPAAIEDYLVMYLGTIPGAGHVQILGLPRFERPDASAPPPPPRSLFPWTPGSLLPWRRRRQAPRPATQGWDPRVFTQDVIAYLDGARALKQEIELYGPAVLGGAERRREPRFSDYEVPWISVLRFGDEHAALLNVSSRGALLQTDTRPAHHLLRRVDANVRERPRLILELESEGEIHAMGRVIRCAPLRIGTQTLYEVAFSFDDSVGLHLPARAIVTRPHLRLSPPNPLQAYK